MAARASGPLSAMASTPRPEQQRSRVSGRPRSDSTESGMVTSRTVRATTTAASKVPDRAESLPAAADGVPQDPIFFRSVFRSEV